MSTLSTNIATSWDDAYVLNGSSFVQSNTTLLFSSFLGFLLTNVYCRFQNITVPKDAIINSAYIEFVADATESASLTINITGHAADNSASFTGAADLEARPSTTASVSWNIPAWTAGSSYQTDSLTNIIQEIVNRSGWVSGNALTIMMKNTGSYNARTARSYDYGSSIPFLYINYTAGGGGGSGETIIRPIFKSFIN